MALPTGNWDTPAWAAEWMTGNSTYTEATAVEAAQRYDIIAAQPRTFTPYVNAMHAANPSLVLLAYTPGPFINPKRTDLPEDLYAHTASGQRVLSTTFNTYLSDLHLQAWKDEQVRACDAAVLKSAYDGCFIDSMGNGIFEGDYLDSVPVDPRTGAPYTRTQWINDARDVANYVRERTDYPVVTNGLGNGLRYYGSDADQLALGSDLSMAEGWLRGPKSRNDAWLSPSAWRQDVDMVADSEAKGSGTLTVTKMWFDGGTTPEVSAQWYRYTLGSFLLGTQGRSAMYFLKDGCTPAVCGEGASDLAHQPTPDLDLGPATAAYSALGNGLFARPFANGTVLVNPGTAAYQATLPEGGTYTDAAGVTYTGTVTVPAHDSLVLTLTGGTVTSQVPTPVYPVDPPPVTTGQTCNGKPATLVGSRASETLTGTPGNDVIVAVAGNDVINGLGGNDTICAGDGNDTVTAADGTDWVSGGNGADTVWAGGGDDTVQGTAGNDTMYGEAGDDFLAGGADYDYGDGGLGRNTIRTCESAL